MSCNGCFNSFSLLRPEKGCPSCGFSYCPKCLGYKIYLPRLKSEDKVCHKCKKASMSNNAEKKTDIIPPDVFYKRIADGSTEAESSKNINVQSSGSPLDGQMRERLNKLKEKEKGKIKPASDAEIAERLQKIKGDVAITSDAELHARLAKLRGIPVKETKPALMTKDLRTEQEQVEDLMKQYLENTAIDCKYKDEFDSVINHMEARLLKLKGANVPEASGSQVPSRVPLKGANVPEASGSQVSQVPSSVQALAVQETEFEDEEESVKKIIEKLKAESMQEEDEIAPSTSDELPFCEICNEDANMRCLGCKYLFCKHCFMDHKDDDDDDDGCNKYEPYHPPKSSN